MAGGIGSALLEHTTTDPRDGRSTNAVFRATGRRVRDFPITAEALL